MNVVEVDTLSYRYGSIAALRDVTFHVPRGALYALLGPNGSGKTTLLQLLAGLRGPEQGAASIRGKPVAALTTADRARIGYVAEGQSLPRWMRLEQVEAFLAPLYDTWDSALAAQLRDRFELDPKRKIRAMSRGEQMKAALLCALAPRPELLIMDEPFTGMDALVKDELVRGLLDSAGTEGWTVIIASHDLGELELLADWVGFLDRGELRLSAPMDEVRERFRRVEVTLPIGAGTVSRSWPADWLDVDQSGTRLTFTLSRASEVSVEQQVASQIDGVAAVSAHEATLREIFVALAARKPGAARGAAA